MLRKISMLGALVVVAVSFGVGNASAAPKKHGPPSGGNGNPGWSEGFSDGRD